MFGDGRPARTRAAIARRDGAFTIFYMGVNLGAMLGPLVCSFLGEKIGWHWGFGAAAVGMLLGLTVYLGRDPGTSRESARRRPAGRTGRCR